MSRLNWVGRAALALFGIASIVVAGCGGGGGGGSSSTSTERGTLAVRMSDAPDPSITAINVTIPKVQAHVGNDWVTVAEPNQTYNLFDLAKSDVLLGQASLPAGNYTQVRLFVSEATVTDSTGTHSVIVPSGTKTGLKINLNYTVSPDTVTEILLDFNVDKSLVKQGNGQYRLQPVIPAVVKVLSGTINGVTTDGTANLSDVSVTATYVSGPNYAAGTQVNTASSLDDGTFKVWALLPGTYTLTFSYTDPATGATKTATVNDVVVTANNATNVGTITLT
ncbi:DUF4382 domain-containing protein [bacterium]|nr:MAG: DUF4382 domain-containing protein [bacterium]